MPASYISDIYISVMKPTLTVQIYRERLMQIYLPVVQETSYLRIVTFDNRSVITRQADVVLI